MDEAEAAQKQTDQSFRADVDKNTVKKDQGLIDLVGTNPESVAGTPKAGAPKPLPNVNPSRISAPTTVGGPKQLLEEEDDPRFNTPTAATPAEGTGRVSTMPLFGTFENQTKGEDGTYAKPTVPPPIVTTTKAEAKPAVRKALVDEDAAAPAGRVSTMPVSEPKTLLEEEADPRFTAPGDGRVSTMPVAEPVDTRPYDDFAKMRDARYGGPDSLVNTDYYAPTWQKSQDAAARTKAATQDEGGRKALLQQEYGAGVGRYDYGSGMQKLDNLLIQNDPDSRAALQSVNERGQQVGGAGFEDLKAQLNAYAGQGKATTQDARASARGAVGIDDAGNVLDSSGIKKTYGDVQGRLSSELSSKQKEISDLSAGLTNRNLTAAQRAQLGLSDRVNTYNRDQNSYLVTGTDPSLNQMATVEEQAKIAALSKLAGINGAENPWLLNGNVGGYDPKSRFSFNADTLRSDSVTDAKALNDQMQNTLVDVEDYDAKGRYGAGGNNVPISKLMRDLEASARSAENLSRTAHPSQRAQFAAEAEKHRGSITKLKQRQYGIQQAGGGFNYL